MVIHTDATFPGTVFACRVIGVLRVEQTENGKTIRNDRFFFCPADKRADKAPRELSGRQRRDLEQFFGASVLDTGKILKFGGWRDGETALASLRLGAKSFEHRAAKR